MTATTTTTMQQQQEYCHSSTTKELAPARKKRHCKHALVRYVSDKSISSDDEPALLAEASRNQKPSPQHQPSHEKKRVRFATSPLSVTTTAVHYYPTCWSEQDLLNSWFSDVDYESFQSDCRTTVTAFTLARARKEQGEKRYCLDGSKFTARGLEDVLTLASSELRDYRKRLHAHHVLKQQFLQRMASSNEPATTSPSSSPDWQLRSVSEQYSAASCQSAAQRGSRGTPY